VLSTPTGNYCRCTGYRPIIDGFYEFSSASPCALGQNCCKNQGNTADATNAANATNAASNTVGELSPDYLQDYIFPPELKASLLVVWVHEFRVGGSKLQPKPHLQT